MGTFKDREDDLKQRCIDHPQVAHDQPRSDSDETTRNSFFRLNDEEELLAGTRNNIDYPAVCNMLMEVKLFDKDKALTQMRWIWQNQWAFLQHVENPSSTDTVPDAVQDAYDSTFAVAEDFIKTMKDDWEKNGSCGAFDQIDFNQFSLVPIGPTMAKEYGWMLYFTNEQKATRITT